jgi:hypothetical protein
MAIGSNMKPPPSSNRQTACLCLLLSATSAQAFMVSQPHSRAIQANSLRPMIRTIRKDPMLHASAEVEQEFDKLLEETKLREATNLFRSNSDLDLSRDRWNSIFDAIEQITEEAEQDSINTRNVDEGFPLLSKSRMEMTDMYLTLKDQGHLRLFGSINKDNMPASGSKTVRPAMLEEISNLSMKALTPEPSNTLLYAGFALAMLEGFGSIAFGLNLNLLFFITVVGVLGDRILVNGAISETIVKIISPETQPKITRHEAGHFLCAYLLGCPVEGYVLSAWAALQDARFGARGVGAGTSFFDARLSSEISSSKITRSSIDRYSVIVMAGIAAEAVNYGRADGGAGDEMALISFLSNLNGAPSSNPAWNDVTIRNQARWGALQAALLIREYRECYDALVDALERGGSLGDCTHAIEKAGRDSGKLGLEKPLGYILEKPGGLEEEWATKLPEAAESKEVEAVAVATAQSKPIDAEESLETLREYKEMVQARLKDIDEKLSGL